MNSSLLMAQIVMTVCLFIALYRELKKVDNNHNYNNIQLNYIKPQIWIKKLFRVKSELLPRWYVYRVYCYTSTILLSLPTIIAYIIYQNDRILAWCITIQLGLEFLDMILISNFIKIERKKKKKSVSLNEALNYPESTEPPEE